MPSPADIPARRRAPAEAEQPEKARRRRNCSNTRCHKRIYYPRYACHTCWMRLPVELQERLKATRKVARKQVVPRDDPFRVAAREARAIWSRTAAGA